jgi:hypothetical protein
MASELMGRVQKPELAPYRPGRFSALAS